MPPIFLANRNGYLFVQVLRNMGAVSPDKSVLRATLRDEARKVIGDTGLLDHLLKHLADQMVTPEGERLRRRHNREGRITNARSFHCIDQFYCRGLTEGIKFA